MVMPGQLPIHAPSALEYFATLVADDDSLPMLEAAVSLAQDEDPLLDVQGVLARVDELGLRLSRRIPADAAPLQRLRLVNRYFFQELGFAGNVNHYYDPRNSLIPVVLESRRGIPITLALLYVEIAGHAGLKAQPLPFPGHVLVKLQLPHGDAVIDPFSGQSLSREDLEERLLPLRQRQPGGDDLPLAVFLQPATGREFIARMLRNLKDIYRSHCDWQRLERVQARLVVLKPEAWEERRDHALVLAEVGEHARAAEALSLYLQHRPDAADAGPLRRRLLAWQGVR